MANKTVTKTKKTTKKSTLKKPKTSRTASAETTNKTLIDRIKNMRADRAYRKAEVKRHKQTDEARKVKAENRAIREKALEQVNEAVIKSKRRKSRPALTLFLALILAGLGGAGAYQYRQIEIEDRSREITELESIISSFQDQKDEIESALKLEEARFKTIDLQDSATMRVPSEWSAKITQLPTQEQVVGDNNVTVRIVSSESRNSVSQFIPIVDYLWIIDSVNVNNALQIQSQSLHCERFDTLSNDLDNLLREHKGFNVYCDSDSEKVEIAVLATPEQYGSVGSNTYFLVTINDVQQIDFNDVQAAIESYSR